MADDNKTINKWVHMKQLLRRYNTRHRLGPLDDIETEEEQKKRQKKGHSRPGYQGGSMADRYQKFIDDYRERVEKLVDYELMMTDAGISSSLDIYADEATQKDSLTGYVFEVEGDDQEVVEEVEKLIHQTLRLDTRAWDLTRRTCAQGDNPYEIRFRKDFKGVYDIKRIDPKRMDRLEEDGKLQGFRIRPIDMSRDTHLANLSGTLGTGFALTATGVKSEDKTLSPFRVVHFMIPNSSDSIYGRSILESARRTWRQVRLMEDSVVIYRISRGAERRIFYLNTGHLADDEIEGYIRNTMAKFRKKPFINPQTKDIDEKSNPLAWDEDFYIPLQSDKDSSRIEQLPGGQNMGEIEDLRYFKSKIDEELKTPTAYMNRDGNFDSKAGLSQQDIRFSRTIERIQGYILEGVMKVCMVHLLLRQFTYRQITSFTIKMTPPSALNELLKLDALTAKLEAAGVAKGLEMLPDIYIMTEIMGMGEDEANQMLQIMTQQRSAAAAAEAAAAGGGGGAGGLGLGAPGGGEEEGADLGAEGGADLGAEGGPEGGLEVAHELPRGSLVVEGQHPVLMDWLKARKHQRDVQLAKRRRVLSVEHMMSHGELGGLKIQSGNRMITEGFKEAQAKANKLITEHDDLVNAEVDKLIAEHEAKQQQLITEQEN